MRSLYTWIIIAMVATASLALLAFTVISDSIERAYVEPVLQAMDGLELESARDALRREGPAAAARYLAHLDGAFGTRHYLLDGSGVDVISHDNRAGWLPRPPVVGSRGFVGARFVVTHRSQDARYWLLSVGPAEEHGMQFLPYYFVVIGVSAILCLLAAVGVVLPMRRLASVMHRFGGGELAARSQWRRRDELGILGRAFDEMADRLERLLVSERRLLQDVSHELRSPLARLTMAVKLARTSPEPAAALDRVGRHLDRLTSLTAEIVEMVRIEGDPQALRWESVDLGELVVEVVADCRAEAEPRACEVRVAGHVGGAVTCDRELVRRALENVLRNAMRFSSPGFPIEVSLCDAAAWASLIVRDYGPGVPEAALERIFEPFFRVDESRDSDRGGIGLGLSIARRAVTLHGGKVTARNAGPGLMVVIELPCSRARQ
ncbi:MAG TPA: HAMP domain-containing sensor histidine kinase [Steroidobacteraceae bacterium]|nr:HAMP domain-containing sensor histidine kinase [Steroidobacteraceae bacterium]